MRRSRACQGDKARSEKGIPNESLRVAPALVVAMTSLVLVVMLGAHQRTPTPQSAPARTATAPTRTSSSRSTRTRRRSSR